MANYINPTQLKEVAECIYDALTNVVWNINGKIPDVTKFEKLVRGDITFDELNTGGYLQTLANSQGIRVVKNGNYVLGYTFCFCPITQYQAEIFIGQTNTPEGTSDTLEKATYSAYSKLPGISLAFRFRVVLTNMLDTSKVTKTGLTPWYVTTLADYDGIKKGTGDNVKIWTGTKAEFESIGSPEVPGTLYCFTE